MRVPRQLLVLGGLVVVAGLAGLWYLFFRPAGPAPVGTGSPAPAVSSGPGTSAAAGGGPGVAGTWAVDGSGASFVGYRVQEQLANVGATTAVGRTTAVTGSMTVDGTTITRVQITADLTALQSDDPRRDGQLRRQALETGRFPSATFTLTKPIDLGSAPSDGQPITVQATGDLTLHGVTRSVTIPLTATRSGSTVTVTGSIEIVFADYSIVPPSAFIVLSVADHGTMELSLAFAKG